MVLLLTALVGVASAGGAPDEGRLALVLAAMLCSQLAIGWSNDYLDRNVDAVHQPSKPVPARLVDAARMPWAIGLALLACAAMGAILGAVPLGLLVAGTCCGLAYNLGIKGTRYSALPFVLAFAVLPLFVWTALDVYRDEFLALYAIGLSLPVAVHVANVLPDLESDRAQGRRTVAVLLGRERAILLTMACQMAPLVMTVCSLAWISYDSAVLVPPLVVYGGLSLAALVQYRQPSGRKSDVRAFRLLAIAAIIFAAGWLAAV